MPSLSVRIALVALARIGPLHRECSWIVDLLFPTRLIRSFNIELVHPLGFLDTLYLILTIHRLLL